MLPGAPIASVVGHQLTVLVAKLCEIRALFQGVRSNVDAELLSKAFALDAELETFSNNFLGCFQYDIIATEPGELFEVFGSHFLPCFGKYRHSYTTRPVALLWNNYRYSRILLNDVILEQLHEMVAEPSAAPLFPDFKDIYLRICAVVRKLACEICESVPSVLELCQVRSGRNRSVTDGLTLLSPLFVAGSVDGPGKPVCDWVRMCLTCIGESMGIRQALTLGQMLKHEPAVTRILEFLQPQGDDLVEAPIDVDVDADADMPYDIPAYNTQCS